MAWRFLAAATTLLAIGMAVEQPPNIVLLMTDDHDAVWSGGIRAMPNLARIVGDNGTEFSRFYVTTSVCTPSRASILTGRYAHSHGVLNNGFMNDAYGELLGGSPAFAAHENRTVATLLQEAGYETMLCGKYMVGYADMHHVPPGWDHWRALQVPRKFYNSSYSLDGIRTPMPPGVHQSDFLADAAVQFLQTRNRSRPFFLHLTPFAPHLPSTPAARHRGLFANATLPRVRSYDQPDDALQAKKGSFVGHMTRLTDYWHGEFQRRYQLTMESLQSVDDMIAALERTLIALGDWDQTYLFYTSDNGFKAGQHRLGEKGLPYEEDILVPFAVRGPGVPAGVVVDELTLNIDLAPTWLALAGVDVPSWMDGRSFAGALHGTETPPLRTEFAVEMRGMGVKKKHRNTDGCVVAHGRYQNCSCDALRGLEYLYIEWCTGEFEYYNTTEDPWQVNNTYESLAPAAAHNLSALLRAHKQCSGVECLNPQSDYAVQAHESPSCLNCLDVDQLKGDASIVRINWHVFSLAMVPLCAAMYATFAALSRPVFTARSRKK